MKERVVSEVEKNRDKVLALSDYLIENPEIAMEEHKASAKLSDYLRSEGFEVEENLAFMATAFRATKKNGEGPRIAFLAEYDALPGYGHACGHNLIAAMSVGAGVALASILDTCKGEVSIIGTPAEEIGEGKPYLIEKGIFDGYDAAMMIHPFSQTCADPVVTTIGGYDFTFEGKTAHAGAKPFAGINALDAVVMLYNGVSVLRQQLKDGTRIHGIVLDGGTAVNSIPDRCRIRLEVRAEELDYYNEVVEKVINCAKGAALATGCKLEYRQFERTCRGLNENPVLVKIFRDKLAELGIQEGPPVFGGSTDMGDVSYTLPAIHPFLKCVENDEFLHTQEFLEAMKKPYAKESAVTGMKLLALTGLALFENPKLINELKA
jgi:amidohydrolase